MRVYYDGEFYEDGRTIELLSLGMVNELGERHYVINGEADYHEAAIGNPWLIEHVFPSLPLAIAANGRWKIDYLDPRVMPRDEMRYSTQAFLEYCNRLEDRRAGRPETLDWRNLELWTYYGAYDHVALMQLWGRMIDKPRFVPMFSYDLQVEFDRLGLDGELKDYVPMAAGEHDAQEDALWNREAHLWLHTTGVTP